MDLHMFIKFSLVDGHNSCCDFCAGASQQRPALLIWHPSLLVKHGFAHAWRKMYRSQALLVLYCPQNIFFCSQPPAQALSQPASCWKRWKKKSLELFRIYLCLMRVLNVNVRCNHARQKVKQALVYSRQQTANFPSCLLSEKVLVFFPSDFFPFPAETFNTQRK